MKKHSDLLFLIVYSLVLFFAKSWSSGIASLDDAYYAQKAKEILEHGHWFTLYYGGEPRFDNQPLPMWLMALSFLLFGISGYAARIPSQLMGVGCIIVLYFLSKELFRNHEKKHDIAFWSGFILANSYIFIRYVRHAMVDSALVFFTCLAILFFMKAINSQKARYFLFWGFACSGAFFSKSIFGIFPVFWSLCFLLINQEFRVFKNKNFWFGCFIIWTIGFSWYWYHFFVYGQLFINEHFGSLIYERAVERVAHKHLINGFFNTNFLADFIFYFQPWLLILLASFFFQQKNIISKYKSQIFFLLIWAFSLLIALSFTKVESRWYALSAYPGLAILTAFQITNLNEFIKKWINMKNLSISIGCVIMLILAITPIELERKRDEGVEQIVEYINKQENKKSLQVYSYCSKDSDACYKTGRASYGILFATDKKVLSLETLERNLQQNSLLITNNLEQDKIPKEFSLILQNADYRLFQISKQ